MTPLDKLNVNYIGLITNDENKLIDEEILNICDGFLFQGGTEIKDYHYNIIEYAYKNNKPILGMCMGCQAIGLFFSKDKALGKVKDITNEEHNPLIKVTDDRKKTVHGINIKEDSILHRLFGSRLMVNSRHSYCLKTVNSPLEVVAKSNGGIIEAVELIDKKQFMIGIQWHAENMNIMQPIFEEFIRYVVIQKNA
jgi:putative glutamine amidotransferase